MPKIKVEKTVCHLDKENLYAVSLRTIEPYGRHYPTTIYVTGIFHKNLEKALEKAWSEFNTSKAYKDNDDARLDSMSNEIVEIDA